MIKVEIILHWAAVAIYAISSGLFIYAFTFKKDKKISVAIKVVVIGLIVHTIALALRWMEAGHGPYLRVYEVYSSTVWISLIMFLILLWWKPNLKFIGAAILPAAFLMIGKGVIASPEIQPLPVSFKNYWLVVHILFAKISYGAILIGTGVSIFYLWKTKRKKTNNVVSDRLPRPEVLDELSYSLIGFGFFNLAIMIIAGSIWAYSAWGSYWSWDPVETWSLISWLFYGIYLHLRRTYGYKGRPMAWFALVCFVVLIFALYGIGYVYISKHSPYISG